MFESADFAKTLLVGSDDGTPARALFDLCTEAPERGVVCSSET
jgi:hypothetical protein